MGQLGTVKVQTQNSGAVELPVFAVGDSGSSVYEIWRVQTAGGTGFIPLVDPSNADRPYVRVQTQNNGVLAAHSKASLFSSVSWSTATDWDNGQSDDGTVHESVTNTDHSDATIVKQGYQIASPFKSANIEGYWPLHEDSGGTANDFSGNNNDGTNNNGVTQGVTGLLDTTAFRYDGSDDYTNMGSPSSLQIAKGLTWGGWVNTDVDDGRRMITSMEALGGFGSDGYHLHIEGDGNWHATISTGEGDSYSTSGGTVNTNTWTHVMAHYDGTLRLFENGTQVGSNSTDGGNISYSDNQPFVLGTRSHNLAGGAEWDGEMWDMRVYSTTLSSSEMTTLYDVVRTQGLHKSSKKTA